MTSQPTLLIFTLGPDRERARRRLLPEPLNAVERELHRSCLESVLEAGRACGWRLAVASPRPVGRARDVVQVGQTGESFGGRFRRALAGAFGEEVGPVVAVGSDSPGLRRAHLVAAAKALASDPERVVLGPAADGGFYLLAAARPLDAELAGVCWRSRRTLETLVSRLEASGREVVLLEPLADLDRPRDLTRWVARARGSDRRWSRLIAVLREAIAALCALPASLDVDPVRPAFSTSLRGRAPPR